MFNNHTTSTGITLAVGLGLFLALLWALGTGSPWAYAQGPDGYSTYYVAPSCSGVAAPCYTTIQAAVDAADDPADVIKVAAGAYTDVHGRPRNDVTATDFVTQVVYISKTVSIQGGYTTTNWTTPHPISQPTILEPHQGPARVLYITGDISATVEGLHITGGHTYYDSLSSGGGVYIITATVTFRNNQVFNNTVGLFGSGAGVYLWHSDATLSGNTIQGNTCQMKYGGVGGGVFLGESTAVLSDNAILDNKAMGGGGSYVVASTATLDGNIIQGNGTGGWGNGAGGGLRVVASTAKLNRNVIHDNGAAGFYGDGGGVALDDSISTLNGNSIVGNTATAYYDASGGGVHISGGSTVLNGNVIRGNSAVAVAGSSAGGGLCVVAGSPTLINNIIADNQANVAGSGLYIIGSSPRLLHNTIARNGGAAGSGLYVAGNSAVALTNTILVSHTVGITVAAGNTATLEGTLWGSGAWANGMDWGGTGTIITGKVNVWGNPGFMDSDTGDYHIIESSSAVGRGVNAGVEDDIDGESRPYPDGSEEYDIGADEFHPSPNLAVTKHASLDLVQTGARLTYTIFVTNTGNVTLNATITDFLPAHVVPTGFLTWSTVIAVPGGIWSQSVPATVAAGYEGSLINVVCVTTQEGVGSVYTHTAYIGRRYLPLVLRNF